MKTRYEHIAELRKRKLVEISLETGQWVLSRAGEDLLDQLDLMRELDGRPGAPQSSSPRRQAPTGGQRGTAAPPGRRHPRDDSRATRGRGAQGTR